MAYRPHAVIRPGTAQKVTVGAAHAETANPVGSRVVQLCSTTACHIVIGASPVATANDTLLPANAVVVYECLSTDKVSVIQDAAGGSLFVTPAS